MNTSFFRHPKVVSSIPWIIGGWTLIILYLTMMPSENLGDFKVYQYDKLGHALIFGGWTFLLGLTQLVYRHKIYTPMLPVALTGIFFGAFIEFMQYILPFKRSASWEDVYANIVGCTIAYILLILIKRNLSVNELSITE